MIAEKPTVKTSWTILGERNYGDTKPGEDKADSGGNNEFCLDKGIERMTGRFYAFPLRLGKEGRSKIRRVPYRLRDTRMIFSVE